MSTTVDERVVEMRFDNRQFESNVQTTLKTLDKLEKSLDLDGAAKGLEGINDAAKKCDMSKLSGAVETVQAKFSALEVVAMTTLANITNSAINAGKAFVKSLSTDNIKVGWDKYAEKTKAVGTLLAQGYDMSEVEGQLERLNWFTDETSYNFTSMVDNISKFTASGKGLTESVTAMEGIALWAALSGQNAQTASRAMYQLSQAMGSFMKKEDYKSIQTANMDTDEFRQKALDAGVAMGTLKKNIDGTYKSLRGGKTSFTKAQFMDHLTEDAWFTSDVMMKVFSDYSASVDKIYEYAEEKGITASQAIAELGGSLDAFSLKAFKAGQEARSWGDVVDSVKDAVGSGWMRTFEIIFGNYEEATKLWTGMANLMYSLFAEGGNTRNDMLAEAFGDGGRVKLIESVLNILEGLLNVLGAVGAAFDEIFPPKTAKDIRNGIESFNEFTKKLIISEETADKLRRTFKGLFSIVDLFTTITGGALKIGLKVISKLFGLFGGDILDVTAKIGDAVSAFRDFADSLLTKGLEKGLSLLLRLIQTVRNWVSALKELPIVQETLSRFGAAFGETMSRFGAYFSGGIERIQEFISRVKAMDGLSLENVKKALADFRDNVLGYFINIGGVFGALIQAAKDFGSDVKAAFMAVGESAEGAKAQAKTALGGLVQFFMSVKDQLFRIALEIREKLADKIGFSEIFAIGIGIAMVAFTKKISDVLSIIAAPFAGIGNVLDSAAGALDSFSKKVKSEALMNVAKSVLILVGALAVITLLDQEKLAGALITLGLLAAGLVAMSFALGKVGNIKDTVKLSSSLVALGASVLMISKAMKTLGDLSGAEALQGLAIVSTLAIGLTALMKVMGSGSKKAYSGAATMIAFALSLKLLAGAFASLGKMKIENAGQTIALMLGAITSLGLIALACGSVKAGSAATILAIVVSLKILAGCFKDVAKIDARSAKDAMGTFVTIFGMFAALMVASQFAGENASKVGSAIAKMSASLVLIAVAFKMIGGMDEAVLTRATDTISKLLLVFAVITAASYFAGEHAAKAGTMLLSMSAAIVILSGVMVLLAHMDPSGLARSLAAIGTLGLIFAALIGVTYFAKDVKGTFVGMTTAFTALVASVAVLSLLDPEGLRNSTIAITALVGVLSLLVASTHFAKKASGTLVMMGLIVAEMAGILVILSGLNAENSLASVSALSILITSLSASMLLLSKAKGISAGTVGIIALMGLVVAELGAVLGVMNALNVGASIETAAALSILLASMAGACLILSKASSLSPATVAMAALMGLVVAELGAVLGVMSAFNVNPSIETAAALSILIASMSGACILLSLVGAAGPAAFIGIGALATLILAVGGIMAGICALTADNPTIEADLDRAIMVMEKIGTGLGAAIGGFVGGVIGGLSSGLPIIGENLSAFMTNIQPFIDGAKGLDASAMEGVQALAGAILTLTAADLIDALTSWLTGGSSLADFGTELAPFGESMVAFSKSLNGLDSELVSQASIAGKTLAEMAATLPNSGGVVGWFTGENDMDEFGAQLVPFGRALRDYSFAVEGIKSEAVENSVIAGKAVAELASNLPNSGGVVGWFMGENDMDTFGEKLLSFGKSLKAYSVAVSGVKGDVVVSSANAAKALVELANNLPNSGGLISWFTGDNNIADFGDDLVSFGTSLSSYVSAIADVDETKLTKILSEVRGLINLSEDVDEMDAKGFTNFAKDLKKSIDVIMKDLVADVADFKTSFTNTGKDVAQGFINGMNSKKKNVVDAGTALGKAALEAAKKALDSHSPSKEMEKLGKDTDAGFVIGVEKNSDDVVNAVGGTLTNAVASGKEALSALRESLNESSNTDGLKKGVETLGETIVKSANNASNTTTKTSSKTTQKVASDYSTQTKAAKSHYEEVLDWIEEEKYYGRLTTEQELDKYKELQAEYQLGSDERKKIDREVYRLQNDLVDEHYQSILDWIEEEKFYSRLSAEDELAKYEEMQEIFKDDAEKKMELDRKVYSLREQLREQDLEDAKKASDDAFAYSKSWIDDEDYYGRMTLSDELAAWKRIRNNPLHRDDPEKQKESAREIYRLEKEIYEAEQQYIADTKSLQEDAAKKRMELEEEYADKVKSVNAQLEQDIQSLNDEYENAFESRARTLYQSYNLFDEVKEKEEASSDTLMKNLEDQVKEFGDWQDVLGQLSARGMDSDLIEELQEMGPSAIAEIKALNSMSDSELDKYVSLWKLKHTQARSQATTELEDMRIETQEKIIQLRQDAETELSEYRVTWQSQMDELNQQTNEQLAQLRTDFQKKVGLIKTDTDAEMKAMTESATRILREAGWDETGQHIVTGIESGIQSKKPGLLGVLSSLAGSMVRTVNSVLGIKSPSRVFRETGNYAGMGLVMGLAEYADKTYAAGLNIGSMATDGLSNALSRLQNVVNENFEPDFTIRPVLDLSDIRSGTSELNGLFGTGRTIGIAASISSRRAGHGSSDSTVAMGDNSAVVSELRQLRGDMGSLAEKVGKLQVVLDTGTLVGEIAEPIDSALGQRGIHKGRGM